MVVPPGRSLSYPNPVKFGESSSVTIAADAVQNGEVRIYSLSGKLIKVLSETDGNNIIEWDGKNENNEQVCPGIYIYSASNGERKITGKFAVSKP